MKFLDLLEPEELIGKAWHRLVGDVASYPRHPDAAVRLGDVQGPLSVFFRGLGGDRGVQLHSGDMRTSGHRLTIRQKLGRDTEQFDRITLDGETLILPVSIDLFEDQTLNRSLYFWLAGFFAFAGDDTSLRPTDPLQADIAFLRRAHLTTQRVLQACPGLAPAYAAFCSALRSARPQRQLPDTEAAVESVVMSLLHNGTPTTPLARDIFRAVGRCSLPIDEFCAVNGHRPFLPVPLWGELLPRRLDAEPRPEGSEPEPGHGGENGDERRRTGRRRKLDQAQREDSLILNNMEKILGLAEMMNINRSVDDDDEDDAKKAADDLDEMTVSDHQQKAATQIKMDLDLPPDAVDSTRLQGTSLFPEWDYRTQAYHADHCMIIAETGTEEGDTWAPDAEAQQRIKRVRRQFEGLRPKRVTMHAQPDGNELDMDAVVRARSDLAASGHGSNRQYLDVRNQARDMAVALLVDVSLSTDAWFENRRVLDVEKEALLTLSSGLEACGDDHAIYAFTSRKRSFVKVSMLKGFEEQHSSSVRRRISALKPGYYTRIGAAIRYVQAQLAEQPHRHRLLLVVTDGKPNDVDHYEGRYGVEDTRKAVQEARRAGSAVFGVTIDRQAQDYFPHIFGRGGYHIVGHVAQLSAALPKIYRQLVA